MGPEICIPWAFLSPNTSSTFQPQMLEPLTQVVKQGCESRSVDPLGNKAANQFLIRPEIPSADLASQSHLERLLGPLIRAVNQVCELPIRERLDSNTASGVLINVAGNVLNQLRRDLKANANSTVSATAIALAGSDRSGLEDGAHNLHRAAKRHQLPFNDALMVTQILLYIMPLCEVRAAMYKACTELLDRRLMSQKEIDQQTFSMMDERINRTGYLNLSLQQRLRFIDEAVQWERSYQPSTRSAEVLNVFTQVENAATQTGCLKPERLLIYLKRLNSGEAPAKPTSIHLVRKEQQVTQELNHLRRCITKHEYEIRDIDLVKDNCSIETTRRRKLISYQSVLIQYLKTLIKYQPWDPNGLITQIDPGQHELLTNKVQFLMLWADMLELVWQDALDLVGKNVESDFSTALSEVLVNKPNRDESEFSRAISQLFAPQQWRSADQRHLFAVLCHCDEALAQRWNLRSDDYCSALNSLWRWLSAINPGHQPTNQHLLRIWQIANAVCPDQFQTLLERMPAPSNDIESAAQALVHGISQPAPSDKNEQPKAPTEAIKNMLWNFVKLAILYPETTQAAGDNGSPSTTAKKSELRILIENLSFTMQWSKLKQAMQNFEQPTSLEAARQLIPKAEAHQAIQIENPVEKYLPALCENIENVFMCLESPPAHKALSDEQDQSRKTWALKFLENKQPFLNSIKTDADLLLEHYDTLQAELSNWQKDAELWHTVCAQTLHPVNPQVELAASLVATVEQQKNQLENLKTKLTNGKLEDLTVIQEAAKAFTHAPWWLTQAQACLLWSEVFNRDCDFSAWATTYKSPPCIFPLWLTTDQSPSNKTPINLTCELNLGQRIKATEYLYGNTPLKKIFCEVAANVVCSDGAERMTEALSLIMNNGETYAQNWEVSRYDDKGPTWVQPMTPADLADWIHNSILKPKLVQPNTEPLHAFRDAERYRDLCFQWRTKPEDEAQSLHYKLPNWMNEYLEYLQQQATSTAAAT